MSEPTTPTELIPIIDGHNDTLLSLVVDERSFYERSEKGHIDRVRAAEGGLAGGFFAIWVPSIDFDPQLQAKASVLVGNELDGAKILNDNGWLSLPFSQQYTHQAVARLLRIEAGEGAELAFNSELGFEIPVDPLTIVLSAAELEENVENGDFSAIIHFEGAEMIDENLYALETFHAAGLRSLGIVWSRPNRFGHGVPFEFPSSPDTGPGLTDLGRELVQGCNALGIMIDLSHLNEKGFWDVAGISDAPLVATHSNAHAISAGSRNLTDRQLDAIKESDGLVGLNFHVGFLRPDGAWDANTPLTVMADHIDYLVDKLGIDRVALGSDFDGATMPAELKDAAGLPKLIDTLRARGYDDESLRKIGYRNWVRVLELTWGA
ncbi:MAG TPA: dipeptidase [Thermomicrobiales bacterium]|nr:dipeptidase [Thermomicrobiales bacterium]